MRGLDRTWCRAGLWATGLLALAVHFASCSAPEKPDGDGAAPSDSASSGRLTSVDSVEDVVAGGIAGSKHDFTLTGGRALDLCTPCHTPHLSVAKPPMLDERPPAVHRLRPFETVDVMLDETSLLCLGCHDGIVAPDVYRSAHATRLSSQLGSSWIGSASLTSHPLGIKYPVGDPTYRSIDAVTATGRIKLPGGRLQCVSCHDPHNTRRIEAMLVRDNQGSRLCLACHRI